MSQLLALIAILFRIFEFVLFARILMSWVPGMEKTGLGQILYRITEPYLGIFRRFIPAVGMIDFSPIVAILALYMIEQGLVTVLRAVM